MVFFGLSFHPIEAGGWAVKTPGGGFVLTRFLLPFHRLEKEEPVRLEDRKLSIQIEHLFSLPKKYELIRFTHRDSSKTDEGKVLRIAIAPNQIGDDL
jgi:hypothetical protein